MAPSLVYIGIAGNVIALDRASGEEVWRTPVKGDFVNVAFVDSCVYAATRGELFRLDSATGEILWRNELKGLGRGLVTIAGSDGQQTIVMREKKQRDEAAAASTTAVG